MKKLSLICAALLLSACGGSGGSSGGGGAIPPPTPAPPLLDMFYTRVNALIGTAPEEGEPGDVSTVTVTEPEDSEPVGS